MTKIHKWTPEQDSLIVSEWDRGTALPEIAAKVEQAFGRPCTSYAVNARISRMRYRLKNTAPRRTTAVSLVPEPVQDRQPYRTQCGRLIVPGEISMPRVEWRGKLL